MDKNYLKEFHDEASSLINELHGKAQDAGDMCCAHDGYMGKTERQALASKHIIDKVHMGRRQP